MKKQKIFAIFLCCVLMLNSIGFAIEIEEVTDDNIVMSLEEAVAFALKNNPGLIDADFKELTEDQEDLYNDAKLTYFSWQNQIKKGGYSYEDPSEYLTRWGHSLEMSKLIYNSFLATKGGTEETISYTVKQMAYSIDELKEAIKLLEKTILKQEADIKIAEVKYSLNMITSLDVEATKQTLTSTKLQLESLKPTLVSLENMLKSLMGFEVSKTLVIELPESELAILEVENLEETIENSLETNGDVIAAKMEYKQKEMNNIIATETAFLDREGKRDAKKAFSDADTRLNNSINTIKDNLYSLYNKVKNSEEKAILSKSEYDQLQIKYNQMKVMHELGMITTHDFNSYEIALINAKNTYYSALHENILLNDRWSIALKYGDVLAKEEQSNEG